MEQKNIFPIVVFCDFGYCFVFGKCFLNHTEWVTAHPDCNLVAINETMFIEGVSIATRLRFVFCFPILHKEEATTAPEQSQKDVDYYLPTQKVCQIIGFYREGQDAAEGIVQRMNYQRQDDVSTLVIQDAECYAANRCEDELTEIEVHGSEKY